nr:hypothetical protein [Tanacetum cinerariifolium]
PEEVGEGSKVPTDTHHTPIVTQPSSSQPQKKQKSRRKQRKETEVPHIKPQTEESVPTPFNDLLHSGDDIMQLSELMELCTKLSDMVLSLEKIKTNQAVKIKKLKKRVKKLEGKKKRTHGLKRIYKVGLNARIVSSDEEGLGDQEDASKQGRIAEIDADEDLSLIDETAQDQWRINKEDMFSIDDLDGDEVIMDVIAGENVEQSTKDAKNEVSIADPVTTAGKDKGKGITVEPEKPLKKKDQIALDEEVARNLEAQMKAKMEEEERIAREKDEANIVMVEQWDKVQAKIDADMELAQKIQTEEQEQLTDAKKARLFMKFLEKRRKFFARKREIKKRNRPPTKAQQRSLMCIYLKNMDGWKPKNLKNKLFDEIQKLFDSAMKRVFANIKREGKSFSRIITPLFETMMVQAPEEVGEGSKVPTDTHHTPIVTQPSSSQPQKKQKSRRKQRKETEVPHIEPQTEESVPTPFNDLLHSGDDIMQLSELMELCTKLSDMVLSLEQIKTNQAVKSKKLKKRVKKLKGKKKRTHGLKRIYKVGLNARIVSSDEEGLGDQEDASKQGRIAEIDADEDLSLIDETAQDQWRINKEEMFSVDDLDGDEVIMDVTAGENVEQSTKDAKNEVSIAYPVTTAGEVVTTAEDVEVTTTAATTQISKDDMTLAQTLIEIKEAKPKARGMKAKMEEEERIAREKDEANIVVVEQWDKVQAKIDADMELAQKIQTEEQEQLTDAEKARLFMEFLEKRRKFFARKREIKKRNRPLTKALCIYLKNMDGWKPKNLKNKLFDEIQKLFDSAMKRVTEIVEEMLKKT